MTTEQQRVLRAIKRWKLSNDDPRGENLLQQVVDAWEWSEMARQVVPGRWVFATGGLSDHEELLEALRGNWQLSSICLQYRLTVPGGLMVVATSVEEIKQMKCVWHCIARWAWGEGNLEVVRKNQ